MDANANPATLRSHPAVIASIVLASVAITACAVVAIAYMLGWVGHGAPPSPTAMAMPGQQIAGTAPDMGLLPGETVVTMPEPPKSAIPPPAPPQLAVPPKAAAAKPVAVPRPSYEERSETTRARIVPESRIAQEGDGACVNCGWVVAIATHGNFWDVEVRYDDGSTQTLRYPERPRLRAGERVRFEDGRLLSDRR